MSDEFDEKLARFERLWDGVTPKGENRAKALKFRQYMRCLLYTSPSPRDGLLSRMPSSA